MENTIVYRYADEQILFKYEKTKICASKPFSTHSHAVFEFLLVVQGDLQYTVRGKEYRVKKNDLVITRPSEMHRISSVPDITYERYNVLFDEKQLPFDIFEKIPSETDVIHIQNAGMVLTLFEKMRMCTKELAPDLQKLMLLGLTQELIVCVLLAIRQKSDTRIYTPTNGLVYEAVQYIERHFSTVKSVDEIAGALFVTKSHLHHLFMEHMGISLKKYIVSRRLSMAEKEIFEGAKPTEIYEKYGFSDYSAFYRAYRAQFGKNPSDKSTTQVLELE